MMTSYAQNREDVRLARVFTGADGFFIGVGGSGPAWHSVTRHFAERGWSGIDTDARGGVVRCVDGACSERVETDPVPPGRGSDDGTVPAGVAACTLAALCDEHGVTSIDFLVVAVPEETGTLLAGHDWTRWRPRVVVVESMGPAATASTHESWEPVLIGAHYRPAAFDGVNRFYVREEDASLAERLAVPVSTRDQYRPYEYDYLRASGVGTAAASDDPADLAARVLVDAADAQMAAVWTELDHIRLQLRRLQAHAAAGERRLAGLRNMARGLAMLLTPAPVAIEDPSLPGGMRGRVLRIGRGLRPLARRFPRLAQAARRWVYRARA